MMQAQNTIVVRRKKASSGRAVKKYYPKDSFGVIAYFFRDNGMIELRARCDKFIIAAFENNKEKNPLELPLNRGFYRNLLRLIDAMHQIYKKEKLSKEVSVSFTLKDLVMRYGQLNEKIRDTGELPLYLPPVEWVHPRRVIIEFFWLRPLTMWKQLLRRMAQSANSGQPVLSMPPYVNTNLWNECLLLHKLIEAAWIIKMMGVPEREE
jgi:hypothetical protein